MQVASTSRILNKLRYLVCHTGGVDAPKIDTTQRALNGWWNGWYDAQFFTCNRWNDERNVNVNRNDNDWNDNWWFAGLRKYLILLQLRITRSCFCQLLPPPSEHFSDFNKRGSK